MALTDGEKHDIVRLLGWPGTVLISTSRDYNNTINGNLTGLNEYIEADLRTLLARVETLDERLTEALDRALVKKIDDIELNPEEMNILRAERKRVVREVSDLISIPMVASGGGMVNVIV